MMGFQQESAEFQGGPPFSGEMLVSGSVIPSYLTTPPQRKTRPEHRAKFKNSSTPIRPRPSTKVSWVSDEWFSLCCGGVVVTLPKTNSSPLKRSRNPKKKRSSSKHQFSGTYVSVRPGVFDGWCGCAVGPFKVPSC